MPASRAAPEGTLLCSALPCSVFRGLRTEPAFFASSGTCLGASGEDAQEAQASPLAACGSLSTFPSSPGLCEDKGNKLSVTGSDREREDSSRMWRSTDRPPPSLPRSVRWQTPASILSWDRRTDALSLSRARTTALEGPFLSPSRPAYSRHAPPRVRWVWASPAEVHSLLSLPKQRPSTAHPLTPDPVHKPCFSALDGSNRSSVQGSGTGSQRG